jgi:tetratricopeptide (TPR) repeat protein
MNLAAVVVVASSLGATADPVELFAEGAAHLRAGRWDRAARSLEPAVAMLGGHPDVRALLGIARYHQGRYRDARASLERALAGETKYAPRCLYYLGQTLSRLDDSAGARKAFERLLEDHPDSAEARKVDLSGEYRRAIARCAPRATTTVILQSVTHDDNALRSSTLQLAGPSGEDWVSLTLVAISARLRGPFEARLTAFHRDFAETDQLDLSSAEGAVSLKLRGGAFSAWAGCRQQWLDGADFLTRGLCGVAVRTSPSSTWVSEFSLGYAIKRYVQMYQSFDGDVASLGIKVGRRGKDDARVRRLGGWLSLANETCDAAYLGYTSATLGAEAEWKLSSSKGLGAKASWLARRHHEDGPTGELREDRRWHARVDASMGSGKPRRPVGRLWFGVTANSSTLDSYTYVQRVWGLDLSIAF